MTNRVPFRDRLSQYESPVAQSVPIERLGPDVFDQLSQHRRGRSREDRGGMLAGLEGEGTSDAERCWRDSSGSMPECKLTRGHHRAISSHAGRRVTYTSLALQLNVQSTLKTKGECVARITLAMALHGARTRDQCRVASSFVAFFTRATI